MPYTPNSFVERLKDYQINTCRKTVLNYERWGLIGPPIKVAGNEKIYSDAAVLEFVASRRLMHGYGLKPKEAAKLRGIIPFDQDLENFTVAVIKSIRGVQA